MRLAVRELKIIDVSNDSIVIEKFLSDAETAFDIAGNRDNREFVLGLVDQYRAASSWKVKKYIEVILLACLQKCLIHESQRDLVIKTLSLPDDILSNPQGYIDYSLVQLLPKADLHVHLDGSVLPRTILEEHEKQGIPVDFDGDHVEDVVSIGPEGITDFMKFLHDCFELPLRIMQTREGLRRVAFEIVRQAYNENLLHIEPRFAPCLHTRQGLSYDEVIDAVVEGLLEGQARYGVSVGLIAGIYRDKVDLPDEHYKNHCIETARAVAGAQDRYKGVIEFGFDIVGKEDGYPPSMDKFLEAFSYVKAHAPNVHITAHAGEMYGTEDNVRYVVSNYGAERIGHGIQILSGALFGFERLKELPFEICPTSNVQLFCAKSIEEHPVYQLIKQGFLVTINTDNRTASRTTLTAEIFKLLGLHGVELYQGEMISDIIHRLVINGIKAAFIEKEKKKELLAKAEREIGLVNRLVAVLRRD